MGTITRTRANVLLVNYAGYPSSPNSLLPDNGLASLAGKLKAAGHRVKVLDYATVDTMRRMVPPFMNRRLAAVLKTFEETASRTSWRARARQAKAFLELKLLSKGLEIVRRSEEKKIAREIAAQVRAEEADLVGFKLWNGDGFSGPLRMAGELKAQFPDLLIAAGGPQVKFFRDQIFDYTDTFDALAVGDGEATILGLAEVPLGRRLAEVPNIYYLHDEVPVKTGTERIERLDSLPFPLYDSATYPAMDADGKIKMIVVEDRRGCESLCNFCVHPFISGASPRSKTPHRIAAEFQQALKLYGIGNFRLGGSSTPAASLLGLAQEIENQKLTVNWTAFARIKDSLPGNFAYLREQGLYSLFFGIESGDQRVLEGMNKHITPEQISRVITAAKAAGIFTVGSIIYPAPFDNEASRAATRQLLRATRPDAVPLQFLGIYPGTEFANHPERYGLEIVYPSRFDNLLARVGLKKKPAFNDPEVQQYLIQYKLQLLFPPKFWRPLPWKINGLAYREYAAATQSFYDDLKRDGLLPMLTDEEALMAKLGGYAPGEFADRSFVNGFTGDWEAAGEMVRRINHSGGK